MVFSTNSMDYRMIGTLDSRETVVVMKFRLLPTLLAGALSCCTAVAFAGKPPSPPPRAPAPQGHPASLEQAVKQVQHDTGGHILAADTVTRGKANVYRIKVLTRQGQVQVVQMHSNARPKPKPGKTDSERGGH